MYRLVFFFANHINKNTSGYTICKEIESVVGVGNVVGAQYLHGLYRVYLKTIEAVKNPFVARRHNQ